MSFLQIAGSGSTPESLSGSFTWTNTSPALTVGPSLNVDKTGFWVAVFTGSYVGLDQEPAVTYQLNVNGTTEVTFTDDAQGTGSCNWHPGMVWAGVLTAGQNINVAVATNSSNSNVSLTGTLTIYFIPTPTFRR